jgi:hypothetical protein
MILHVLYVRQPDQSRQERVRVLASTNKKEVEIEASYAEKDGKIAEISREFK